jgi:phage terminase large subunit
MVNEIEIPKCLYSDHFIPILESKHRYVVCFGGRGSSKTHHIMLKLLLATFRSKHVSIYYCRRNFETIRSNTYKDFINLIKLAGLDDSFTYSTAHNSSMVITNNITGNSLYPYGLVEAEKTKGISQATHIFVDEITENNKESIDMIDSVLRTPQAEYLQFICAFNPVDEDNFIRSYFFDENNSFIGRADYGDDLLIHHSTLEHNEYIDKEAYKISLIRKYGHNQNLLDVNLYGKWGKAEVDKPYIPTFDKAKHVITSNYNNDIIYLSFDFNVDPITCIAGQKQGNEVNVIEEFVLRNSDIYELCEHIKIKLPKSNYLMVTGDATGKNRQAISKGGITYYQVIRDILRLSDSQFLIPSVNHSNLNSRELMSRAFHLNKCNINNTCTYLINDLTYCEVGNDGKLLKKNSGADKQLSHLMDCLKYLLINFFKADLKLD